MSDIRDYQVDHLLLLVGANPLPNAVAGKLLTTTEGTITLIHSRAADSLDLAQRLKFWFLDAGYANTNIDFVQVEEAKATSVYQRVRETLKNYEHGLNTANKARVGLNYTGGTKVMSVQAHRALKEWAGEFKREAIFSYLDAQTLRMFFDPSPGRDIISFPVSLGVDISIGALLGLHDWEPRDGSPVMEPALPQSATTLLAVHSNPTDHRVWTEWLRDELFRNARKQVTIRPPFWISQAGKPLQGQYEVKQPAPNDKWKSKPDLRKLTLSWPNLPDLERAIRDELGQGDTKDFTLTAGAGPDRCKDEEDFCRWLSGTWLESAVLSVLQNCPQELHLRECCMDVKPKVLGSSEKRELFQFDVVAIRGYQLFAFSCTTESGQEGGGKGLLKHKLFEAYVRARQMGGDEACVALICCMEEDGANKLEDEMRRDINLEGRIRVFGRESLVDLIGNITNWVREQSKEG